ncbi:MAG: FhaA domain-containing protein [Acidobacteriota bacterium]
MANDSTQILAEIEKLLTEAIRANDCLQFEDLEPSQVIQQISDELAKKRFIWLGNETYVPNKLIGHLPSHDPDKLEELEVIFNSQTFIKLLNQYITKRGFKMFDTLKVEIKVDSTLATNGEKLRIEFSWPSAEEAVEDVTVKVDETQGRILEVYSLKPEIPRLARLSLLSGEVYRDNYLVTKRVTNVGRLRNVIDKKNKRLIRRNDFIFARNTDDASPNSTVSRQHATIEYRDERFYLFDNGSANGTSIERAGSLPIEVLPDSSEGVQLEHYDIIRFGTALVRFEDNAKIGLSIDNDAVHPLVEGEISGETQTTIKLTRAQIEAEMSKLLDSE